MSLPINPMLDELNGLLQIEMPCALNKSVLSRRERRRIDTRDRLFNAAMMLFSENDYDSVTVEMITELADVGKGTFFNYFVNKEAVIGYRFQTTLEFMEMYFSHPNPSLIEDDQHQFDESVGPVWRQILSVSRVGARAEGQCRNLSRTLLALSLKNDQVREASRNVRDKITSLIQEQIEKGQGTGEFRSDISSQSLTNLLCEAYFGVKFHWAVSDGHAAFEELLDEALSLIWQSVRNPNTEPK